MRNFFNASKDFPALYVHWNDCYMEGTAGNGRLLLQKRSKTLQKLKQNVNNDRSPFFNNTISNLRPFRAYCRPLYAVTSRRAPKKLYLSLLKKRFCSLSFSTACDMHLNTIVSWTVCTIIKLDYIMKSSIILKSESSSSLLSICWNIAGAFL